MFMVILGGMASIAGPVLGGSRCSRWKSWLKGFTTHWQIILGPLLVLSVIFFRRGLAGIFSNSDDKTLEVQDLHKRFGALKATDGVHLGVMEGGRRRAHRP